MSIVEAERARLRPATPADLDAMCALLTSAELPIVGVAAHLPGFIVAEDREGLVGVIGRETYGDFALLRSVAVHTRARGTGLGTTLLHALETRAREEGVRSLVLLTTTADDWFPRFGYARIARESVPDPLLASEELRGACPASAVVMTKQL